MTNANDSVTQWLRLVEEGQTEAATALWRRYSEQLLALAKSRLRAVQDPLADEEDLAVCVFASLVHRLQSGTHKPIENRQHLWNVLAWATRRQATDRLRRENALKRSPTGQANRVPIHEMLFRVGDLDQQFIDTRLPQELMVDFLDELTLLESKLPTEELRSIARLRLEGWQNQEIADQLRKSLSSVERKLRIIREVWLKELSK